MTGRRSALRYVCWALASTLREANFEVVVIDAAIDPEYLTHIECESVDALCLQICMLAPAP